MRSEWRSPQGHTRLHADGCSAPPRPPASHQAVSGRPSLVGGPWVPVARSARACRVQAAAHAVSAAPGREQSRVRRDGSPGWSQLPACGTRTGPPGRHGLSARGPPTHRSTRKHNPQTPTAHPRARATPPTDAHPAVTGTRCRASVLRAVRGGGVGSAHVRAPLNKPRTRSPVCRTSRTRAKLGTRWQISFPELHRRTRAPERRAHGTGTERHVSARSPRSTQPHEGPAHKEDGP